MLKTAAKEVSNFLIGDTGRGQPLGESFANEGAASGLAMMGGVQANFMIEVNFGGRPTNNGGNTNRE